MSTFAIFAAGTITLVTIFVVVKLWRGRSIEATVCGHRTKIRGSMTAFGETVQAELPVESSTTEYCLECLQGMTIRCAWCAKPIFPGLPITLYSPADGAVIQADAVMYRDEADQETGTYLGCLRPSCAEYGLMDMAGYWLPPGKVYRRPSLLEEALQYWRSGGQGAFVVLDCQAKKS